MAIRQDIQDITVIRRITVVVIVFGRTAITAIDLITITTGIGPDITAGVADITGAATTVGIITGVAVMAAVAARTGAEVMVAAVARTGAEVMAAAVARTGAAVMAAVVEEVTAEDVAGANRFINASRNNSKPAAEFFHANLVAGKNVMMAILWNIRGYLEENAGAIPKRRKAKAVYLLPPKLRGVLIGDTDIKLQGLAFENHKAFPKIDDTHQKIIANLKADLSGGGKLGLRDEIVSPADVLIKGNFTIKTNGIFVP